MTNNLSPIVTKNRKGLSAVITNLIIILLVIVAVGIIWTVVQGLIKESTQQISTKELTGIDANIESVDVEGNMVHVGVKNSGTDTMTGVELIIGNGRETTAFTRDQSIGSKATKVFAVDYSEVGIVKTVSIAPRYETEEGETQSTQDTSDTAEVDNENALQNIGATAWWKMDGDAHDEFGANDGILPEGDAVNCEAEGKYGQACEFNSTGDNNITVSDVSTPVAYAFWYKNGTSWTFYYNDSDSTYENTQDGGTLPSNAVSFSDGDVVFGGDEGGLDEVIFFDQELKEGAVRALYYLDLTTA